jgi:hypothetical protein
MTLVADLKTFPDTVEPALPLQIQCLTLVQAHYPERMGRAVVGHAPAMFWLMWKAVTPFIDPVTKAKVAFCTNDAGVREETKAHIGLELLYETLGGSRPDHELDVVEGEQRLRKLEEARRAQLEATAKKMGMEGWVQARAVGCWKGGNRCSSAVGPDPCARKGGRRFCCWRLAEHAVQLAFVLCLCRGAERELEEERRRRESETERGCLSFFFLKRRERETKKKERKRKTRKPFPTPTHSLLLPFLIYTLV